MIARHPLTRRTLLRGMGATVALPWLESLARAAEPKPPVRLGFVYVPNGVNGQRWHARSFDELSPAFKALTEHKRDVLILQNLALNEGRGHGDVGGDHARATASFLTAAHANKSDGKDIRVGGVSVDQLAAGRLGHLTRIPSLELACDSPLPPGTCEHGYSLVYRSGVSWRSATSLAPVEHNPRAAFARLFGTSRGNSASASVLDLVQDEAKSLDAQLGGADRRKLDEYLHSVRDVEKRVNAANAMPPKPLPTGATPPGPLPMEIPDHIDAMLDLLVLAFQTDSTRIVSVMLALGGSNRAFPFLGLSSAHHGYSHHGGKSASLDALHTIDTFYLSRFARLLAKLKAVPEAGGSLLDHCLLLYGSPMNDGNGHTRDHLPILLAGSGGGAVTPGRLLALKNETPLANLFLNLLDAVGVDEKRFSDSTGRLVLR